jgi:hypothetical protein
MVQGFTFKLVIFRETAALFAIMPEQIRHSAPRAKPGQAQPVRGHDPASWTSATFPATRTQTKIAIARIITTRRPRTFPASQIAARCRNIRNHFELARQGSNGKREPIMIARYFALVFLSVGFLAASQTTTPAQNATLLPEQAEVPVAPSTPGTGPGTLSNETTGANPLTGLPCSGEGALATTGAGALPDATNPPAGTITPADQGAISLPSLNSVFGPTSALGAC